jgi:hypothetical protein
MIAPQTSTNEPRTAGLDCRSGADHSRGRRYPDMP